MLSLKRCEQKENIFERVHYVFKYYSRRNHPRCQMLLIDASLSFSSYSTTTTTSFMPYYHHHHHFYYPAASMNFYFSANWVFLILRPNRMRASYFARLQLGIFTTIVVVLAAYLFLFCLYSKILRLYASFKRCLFTCIVILFFAKRIIGLFHLEFSRWVLTCSPYL